MKDDVWEKNARRVVAAAKKGLTIFPIMYGRAKALLGLVAVAPRGSKKKKNKKKTQAARSPGRPPVARKISRRSGALSLRAVDVQITRLRRKIEPEPKAPRYLRTVWGKGYVLWPD